jgi:outer membrane protein OmpA-like peptidoglycan-associated protein
MSPLSLHALRLAGLTLVLAVAVPVAAQESGDDNQPAEPPAPSAAPAEPPHSPAPPASSAPAQAAPRAPKVPLDVAIDKSKVDLKEHHLELVASRNLVRVTAHVVGDSGAVLAHVDRDLQSHPAGAPLVVSWTPGADEPVSRIEVFVWDADGYYKGVALTPWAVSVPHEEVNFATDSAVIGDSDRPKLEASLAKVREALAKHPEIQGVNLFIAGHTDTVGDGTYNLKLSRKRAEAIAQWFRQHGLRIGIGWEGFGETALLVKTADNVDEPRNRRVDYILSVDEPVYKSTGARPVWKRVP